MKLLDNQKELLEKYLEGDLNLEHFINRHSELQNVLKSKQITDKLLELLNKKYQDNFVPVSFALSSWELKDAKEVFGKGIKPKGLGEGAARAWFFEIQGHTIFLFVDSRGMSIEIEEGMNKKEYASVLTELILEMLVKPNSNFENYCKQSSF